MRRSGVLVLTNVLASVRAPAADCNRNGVDDVRDIETGASRDCNHNWIPDECDRLPINYGLEEVETIHLSASLSGQVLVDLEGDADLDLAFTEVNRNEVILYQNLGSLHFEPPTAFPDAVTVADYPEGIVAADLDGDAVPDLATVSLYDAEVSVLLNDGRGRFAVSFNEVAWRATALEVGDLDADGDLDLVAAINADSIGFDVLWNQGRGTFSPFEEFSVHPPISNQPPHLALGQLISSGRPDILMALGDGTMVIAQNPTLGKTKLATNLTGFTAALADLDGDGLLDAATDLGLFLGLGFGRFTGPIADAPRPVRPDIDMRPFIADLDGDGERDVLFAGFGPVAALNHGGGRFGVTGPLPGLGPAIAGDLDGSGQISAVTLEDLKVLTPRPRANSRDCNSNLTPDECDIADGRSPDCNQNGVPDECDLASGVSEDCDQSGVLDVCEKDCNHNGIHDDCDLANRTSRDADGDGILDECGAVFTYGFEAPTVLQGMPGEHVTFDAYLTLSTTNEFTGVGVQGWMMSAFSDRGTFKAITVNGLEVSTLYVDEDGVRHDPYPFDLGDSFSKTAALGRHYVDHQRQAAITSIIMRGNTLMALQPRGTQRVARVTMETAIPTGESCETLVLEYDEPAQLPTSPPIYLIVGYHGRSWSPALTSAAIEVCPARFRRGDANSDGSVDISDAIFTLASLFLGGEAPGCREAADVNSDALLDLSDPVYLLESLFLGGGLGRIGAPGPYQCGIGPQFRGLSCASSPCSVTKAQ